MDAIYSPSTQAFALIPRFSSSSSPSSSSSLRLSLSRIQSIRDEFFGCGTRLRHRALRKCKWKNDFDEKTDQEKAVHEGGSALRRDDQKNIQTSGLPASEHDQEGRVTNKHGFCTPMEAEHLHIDNLESNNSILEETDSTQEDKDGGVKPLYQEHSSSPEDAPNPEQRDLPDSNLSDLGAFASALSEKSEKVGIALPDESSELISVQSLEICTEASDFADYGRDTHLDILPPAPMIEINGAVSGAVETAPIKENDYEESNHQHDERHIQASICNERTKSGREELHLFYEDTSISDHPQDLPVLEETFLLHPTQEAFSVKEKTH
ncbi:hypothetical protein Cgig2_032585 [Carnegiea gigantea]|uniref:Uncharacterized protein n=1 Tax=Carnegiea gigantea TaxID=171969 RepID=A0A9Q1QSR7_9CARY|nr:hypothetical protein Cgig2_032585 [Carnegiea gigantea]